jgi:hypothetical protein
LCDATTVTNWDWSQAAINRNLRCAGVEAGHLTVVLSSDEAGAQTMA